MFSLASSAASGDDEMVEGVRVLRADADLPWLPDDDLVARMASANHQLVAAGGAARHVAAARSSTPTTGSWPGPATR